MGLSIVGIVGTAQYQHSLWNAIHLQSSENLKNAQNKGQTVNDSLP
ncbi:hypothetical protein [Psychrobacter aquaticus]|uniref:Uncharacterized protein n=1 Tax=Psychrobacter aquaticus CMS 56 TaxID=1354303 RepID=U4T4X1_9GAMM|nr:hypothetical protein [Psychrobacter aquaticus]ERL56417.1 hypothetical protein M917_0695 [Psychrobacter aquaticus CMS 56]